MSRAKALRIVYFSDRCYPAPGGLEVFLRNVTEAMARRHHVTVVAACHDDRSLPESLRSPPPFLQSDPKTPDYRIVPVKLTQLRRIASSFLSLEPSLVAIAPRKHYQAVHASFLRYAAYIMESAVTPYLRGADLLHSFGPWALSRAVARLRPTAPHVVTGFLHAGFWADDAFTVKHFLSCDHVIALTRTERDDYIRLGVPPSRVSVVPVPAPLRASGALEESPVSAEGSVLFLGVKREYKGLDVLLSAASIVWREMPETRFVFAGARTDYSRALFSQQRPDPRLVELDHVDEAAKQTLLDSCSLLCLPSATEIMPNVVLEAWLAGKPVITSLTPSLQELVGSAGLCVEREPNALARAIIRILAEPALAQSLGARGRRRCLNYHTVGATTDRLDSLYCRLLSRQSLRALHQGTT
jgi:glycosyltransferase involved in cell wall biosynthesis